MSKIISILAAGLLLATPVLSSELVLYWGQNSAGNEKSLGEYCSSSDGDIYVISFLNQFSGSGPLGMNLADHCETTFSGSSLLNCPSVAQDIQSCQSAGKKVFISLGGAVGQYGFQSDDDGAAGAQLVWDTFGGGSTSQRPFGDVKVDGFDLDIENNNSQGYVGFSNKLRQLFAEDSSKSYYISAAPQCPYPDASVGDVISQTSIDYVWIQFYNNYCSLAGNEFNWGTWENYATNTSPNKNVKLFIGLPGSSSAAGSGYVTPDVVQSALGQTSSSANFGGIMLWDASQANNNMVNGQTYAAAMEQLLGGSGSSPSTPTTSEASAAASESSSAPSSVETSSANNNYNWGGKAVSNAPLSSSEASATADSNNDGGDTVYVTAVSTVTLSCTSTGTYTTSAATPASISLAVSDIGKAAQVPSLVTSSPPVASPSATSDASSGSSDAVEGGACTSGSTCINGGYAVCNFGKWATLGCAAGTTCQISGGNAFCGWPQRQAEARGAEHHVHRAAEFPVVSL